MAFCNETHSTVDNEVKYSSGLTFHELGLIICAVFGGIAILVACYLLMQHALHYSKPSEQKHIIRILFMIPIYALVSFLSYYYYKHAIYFEVLRDCYEAFAIAAFFTLLCNYIAPSLHEQKEYFRTIKPKNWILPISWFQRCSGGPEKGPFRRPASGLTWFNINWIGVFQYCFIRVLFTIVSVITEAAGRYCEASLNPAFGHIWVMVFEGASVSVAMYCLIQFYYQLKEEIAEHRPLLKILCIKLVIFFSFWQSLLISFVSSANGPLQPTDHIAYPDIKVGIPSVLLCLEMAIFAVMHLWAFPWRGPYSISANMADGPANAPGSGFSGGTPTYSGGRFGERALADAFNPWDIIKASARGFRWLFVGRKHRRNDSSYRRSGGPSIIATPADAWPASPNPDAKVPMHPLTKFGTATSDGDLGSSAASGMLHPSPYSPYPESSHSSNPFDDDTTYHGSVPLRSQEDVNEYVRAGSFRTDPFADDHRHHHSAAHGTVYASSTGESWHPAADDDRHLLGPGGARNI